jgi:heparan-alpha-glucosaminide N-acetyltransferase
MSAEKQDVLRHRRLRGVDAFRGAVLAFMLFTPPIGDPATYPLMRHATWDGLTFSDLVLPTFLVTSGASLALLLRPPTTAAVRLRLVRRLLALLVLGAVYNAIGASWADLSQLRLTGVLQLIGLTGALAALVVLLSRIGSDDDRPLVIGLVAAAAVAAYGVGLLRRADVCLGVDRCSPYHPWDVNLLGVDHVYGAGQLNYDPEGLAVVGAATGLVLVGYLAGRALRLHRPPAASTVALLALAGGVLAAASLLADNVWAYNKRLHTPSFSLIAAGTALTGLALAVAALDLGGRPERVALDRVRAVLSWPFVALGRNALVVYFSEHILLTAARDTPVGTGTLQDWLLAHAPFEGDTQLLGFSLMLLLTVAAITGVMHALRWHIAL